MDTRSATDFGDSAVLGESRMKVKVCRHCREPIGRKSNYHVWYHHLDDGPDAYLQCKCQCDECSLIPAVEPPGGWQGAADPCCDGEVAEP
jgi:hypothetical protein